MFVAGANFNEAERDALRSLLALLRPYLSQIWMVGDFGTADVVLVNLDQPDARPYSGPASVTGCAQRPRLHPAGTIHRPLRVPEMLALLTEAGQKAALDAPQDAASGGVDWQYQLVAWPADFPTWPRESWALLAILTYGQHGLVELAERSGLNVQAVEQYLERLQRMHLVERFGERRQPVSLPANNGWRGLANRVGRLLGFAA